MREWENLSQEDKNEVVCKAFEWQKAHSSHVLLLIMTCSQLAYPPSGADLLRPELWKEPHWKWFNSGGEKVVLTEPVLHIS